MSEWIVYSKDGLTERCSVKSLEYNGEWMGKCNVSVIISSPSPIEFEIGDFLEYRGERFEINYDPSVIKQSSRDTHGEGFKYENVIFNSLSDELTRCDFLDYVPSDNQIHYTSLPTFSFFADNISKLAERIQVNLDRIYKDDKKWTINVHLEYVNKTNVNITANNITCWDALALVKTEFDANFVIKGRAITIGTEGIAINKLFSYGKGNGLVSIERNAESEQKIITRLRAYGSTKNMPESYYKNLGMKVFFTIGEYSTFEQSVSFYIKTKYNSLNMFTTEWQEQSVGSYTPYKIKVRLNEVAVTAMVALNEGDIDSYINVSSTYEKDSTNLDQFMSDLRSNRYSKLYVESGVVQTAFPYEEREYLDNLPNNMAVRNLMLPSFPENQDPYIDSDNIEMLGVREATVFFDGANGLEEIYPTLPSENGINQINSAEQIADDGVYAEGSEIPTFEIYLNDLGFDINDHKSTAGNPIVAMKDGMCGGREFEVQAVESYGTGYKLTCNRSYDDALDLYFPYNGYQIKSGDTFTLLNIAMPDEYVQAASERLLEAAKEYLAKNDYVRYSYIPKVDNVILARQHDEATANGERSIHDTIKEGDLMLFEDDDLRIEGSVIISTLSIKEGEGRIPQYEITLNNEKAVGTFEKIQNQIDSIVSGSTSVKGEGGYNSSQINSMIEVYGSKKFLRKDKDDRSKGKISSDKGIEVGKYVQGVSGAIIQVDKDTNKTIAEVDNLHVRMKAYFDTLEVVESSSVGGKAILSPAGSVKLIGIEDRDVVTNENGEVVSQNIWDYYRCYFLAEQDGESVTNKFVIGDQVYSKTFNATNNKYFWRLVVKTNGGTPVDYNGKLCHYIDLSKSDCDANSDAPSVGDVVCHRGNRNDTSKQNFIEFSSVENNAPYITLFQNVGQDTIVGDDGSTTAVNPYSLEDKDIISFGYDSMNGQAYMRVYGDMYIGAKDDSTFIKYTKENGVEIKGKLSVGTKLSDGRDLEDTLKKLSPEGYDVLVQDVKDLSEKVDEFGTDLDSVKQQTDRQFTIWFFNYEPTLYNEPASNWNTPELKEEHDQDMFYYRDAGKAWRFENGKWESITDQDTIRALELIAATRKEVDDMSYLTKALKEASPTVIENGLVMSTVVAVQNQDGDVEAFINGSNLAKDEEHGKLLLAGGIPEEGGTLEERSKNALTRIYEDGTLYASKGIFGGFIRSEFALVTACDAISVSPLYNDRAWKLGNVLYVDATFEEVVLPCGNEYAGARVIIMDTYFIKSRMATYPTVIRTEDGNGILCGILSTGDSVSPNDIPAIQIDCGAVEFVYKYIKKEDDTYYQRWVLLSNSCATIEVFK